MTQEGNDNYSKQLQQLDTQKQDHKKQRNDAYNDVNKWLDSTSKNPGLQASKQEHFEATRDEARAIEDSAASITGTQELITARKRSSEDLREKMKSAGIKDKDEKIENAEKSIRNAVHHEHEIGKIQKQIDSLQQQNKGASASGGAKKKSPTSKRVASSVLEPEISLRQLLTVFSKQKEKQQLQTQIEVPPKK